MHKIAVIGDAHLRLSSNADNARLSVQLLTLEKCLKHAVSVGCSYVVLLGDVYDSKEPSVALINRTNSVINSCLDRTDCQLLIVPGNHDGAQPLELTRNESYACPEWLGLFPYHIEKDWSEVVSDPAKLVLCFHNGIAFDDSPRFLLRESHVIPRATNTERTRVVIAGHWHKHKPPVTLGTTTYIQAGAISPNNFSDDGIEHYGWMYVLSASEAGAAVDHAIRVPGIRYVTVATEGALAGAVASEDTLYLRTPSRELWRGASELLEGCKGRVLGLTCTEPKRGEQATQSAPQKHLSFAEFARGKAVEAGYDLETVNTILAKAGI